jgi:hypothetical protein
MAEAAATGFRLKWLRNCSIVHCTMGGASFPDLDRKEPQMHKSNFWTSYAEATELSIEGNRLIAQGIAELVRGLWQRTVRSLDGLFHNLGQNRQLPPA